MVVPSPHLLSDGVYRYPVSAGYEIVEHTADVGLRAWGATLEETFEQATHALLEISGAVGTGRGESEAIEVEADDLAALLADWLGEVLYLQDARDAVIDSVRVEVVDAGRARGAVSLSPKGERSLMGTAVKAITYHQLEVELRGDLWTAQVFVDV